MLPQFIVSLLMAYILLLNLKNHIICYNKIGIMTEIVILIGY